METPFAWQCLSTVRSLIARAGQAQPLSERLGVDVLDYMPLSMALANDYVR